MNSISKRYIYETKYKSWVVRIPGHHTKSFPYDKYNGKTEALKISGKWRDEECKKLDIVIGRRCNNLGKCRGNAKGYYLIKKYNAYCWRAAYNHDGKTKTKTFSVNKYGYEHARKLAKQHRIFLKSTVLVPFEDIT